jgi:outer membrane protein assembly factor BamB
MAKPNTETMAAAIPKNIYLGVLCPLQVLSLRVLIKLNGSGTYIFKFAAAFSVGANTEIILENGAEASEVFDSRGAVAIGADAKNKGSVISNSGQLVWEQEHP